MAYGTATVPKVDKIFGPGNAWVTAAKQLVAADPAGAACDLPAGPSEVLVIADARRRPGLRRRRPAGPGRARRATRRRSWSPTRATLAAAVAAEFDRAAPRAVARRASSQQSLRNCRADRRAGPRRRPLQCRNDYAPEHLIMQTREPRALLDGSQQRRLGVPRRLDAGVDGRLLLAAPTTCCRPTAMRAPTAACRVADFQRRMTVQEAHADGPRAASAPWPRRWPRSKASMRTRARCTVRLDAGGGAAMSGAARRCCGRRSARSRPTATRAWEPALDAPACQRDCPGGRRAMRRRPGSTAIRSRSRRALVQRLAALYGVRPEQLLVRRGSDEAIDLLVRVLLPRRQRQRHRSARRPSACTRSPRASRAPACATVPLQRGRRLRAGCDGDPARAVDDNTKLVFVCSPNNPTGNRYSGRAAAAHLARALAPRALLVVDEAYIEFAGVPSLVRRCWTRTPNLVVLRTLSKAHGLAGARCGALIAAAGDHRCWRAVMPPYAITELTVEAVLRAARSPRPSPRLRARVARDRCGARAAGGRAGRAAAASAGLAQRRQFPAGRVRATPARRCGARAAAGLLLRDFSGSRCCRAACASPSARPEENDRLLESAEA